MDTDNDTDAGYSMSSESAGISPYTSPNINNEASKIAIGILYRPFYANL